MDRVSETVRQSVNKLIRLGKENFRYYGREGKLTTGTMNEVIPLTSYMNTEDGSKESGIYLMYTKIVFVREVNT